MWWCGPLLQRRRWTELYQWVYLYRQCFCLFINAFYSVIDSHSLFQNVFILKHFFVLFNFKILKCVLWLFIQMLYLMAVRLVGSTSPYEGRLEVYHNGVWGTVCDDFFDDTDARVACFSLGFGWDFAFLHNQTCSVSMHIYSVLHCWCVYYHKTKIQLPYTDYCNVIVVMMCWIYVDHLCFIHHVKFSVGILRSLTDVVQTVPYEQHRKLIWLK